MRVPIGIRIHRSTHQRLRLIARERGVPIGEVVDMAVKAMPPAQCELALGKRRPVTFVRCHARRTGGSILKFFAETDRIIDERMREAARQDAEHIDREITEGECRGNDRRL